MPKLSPDHHLSGSTLAAYMGHSPWQDAYDVVMRARDSLAGIPRPELDTLQIDMGDAAENVTLKWGCRMVGLDPDEIGTYSFKEAKKHYKMPLYYSDDGLHSIPEDEPILFKTDEAAGIFVMTQTGTLEASGTVVLEAKYTTTPQREDDPPLYRGPIQLQAGMMCHHADVGILFTNYAGRKITAHIYNRHNKTEQAIERAVQDFERHMAADSWPQPRTVEEAAKLYPNITADETVIKLDPKAYSSYVKIINETTASIKEAEELKSNAQAQLMAAMGDHTKAEVLVDNKLHQVSWPVRNYKAKPADYCPSCNVQLKPGTEARSVRQKTVAIKELDSD